MDVALFTPTDLQPTPDRALGPGIVLDVRYDGLRVDQFEQDRGQRTQNTLLRQFRTQQVRTMLGAYGHFRGRPAAPTHPDYLRTVQQLDSFRTRWAMTIQDVLVDRHLHRISFTHIPLYQCSHLGAVSSSWYRAITLCTRFCGKCKSASQFAPAGACAPVRRLHRAPSQGRYTSLKFRMAPSSLP